MKSQNCQNGYKIHTNQKAGLSCEAHMFRVEEQLAQCSQDPNACRGISQAIMCMDAACQNTPIPCPR